MFNEQQYDKFFSQFNSGSSGSGIKEVYNIMPYMNPEQIQILCDGKYYADKYDLPALHDYLDNIVMHKKYNRSLGLFPSVKNLLKYMTLDEKVRSVKINSSPEER